MLTRTADHRDSVLDSRRECRSGRASVDSSTREDAPRSDCSVMVVGLINEEHSMLVYLSTTPETWRFHLEHTFCQFHIHCASPLSMEECEHRPVIIGFKLTRIVIGIIFSSKKISCSLLARNVFVQKQVMTRVNMRKRRNSLCLVPT